MSYKFNRQLDLNKKHADAEIVFNDKIKLLNAAKKDAVIAKDNWLFAAREYARFLINF